MEIKSSDELKLIKVSDLCRTCLTCDGATHDIDEAELICGEHVKLTDMLQIFNNIQATYGDNFPNKICTKCLSQLKTAFTFAKKSIKSQNILINILTKSKTISTKPKTEDVKVEDQRNTALEKKKYMGVSKVGQQPEVLKITKQLIPKSLGNSVQLVEVAPPQQTIVDTSMKFAPTDFVQIPNKQELFILKDGILTHGTVIRNSPPNNNINVKCDGKTMPIMLQEVYDKNELNNHNAGVETVLFGDSLLNKTVSDKATLQYIEPQNRRIFKCSKCLSSFKSKELFLLHLKNTHIGKIHLPLTKTCSVCNISFETADGLREHNISIHFSGLLRSRKTKSRVKIICSICKKECSNHYQLKQHLKTIHMVNSIVCKKCGWYSSNASNFQKHTLRCKSNNEETLLCDMCPNVSITSVEQYKQHNVEKHHFFICIFCTKGFHSEEALISHNKLAHDDSRKMFRCVYCLVHFLSRWVLIKHLKTKHDVDPGGFVCGVCDNNTYIIGSKNFLDHLHEYHKIEKSSDNCLKNKECAISKNMSEKANCNNHVHQQFPNNESVIHSESDREISSQDKCVASDEKQAKEKYCDAESVTCKLCSETFNSNFEYKKHTASAHGIRYKKRISSAISNLERPSITFARKIERETVKRDNEGAYLCEICSKRFLRLVNLEKHFSRHMMSSLHCVRCGHNAENAAHMEEHLKDCRSAQAAEKLVCHICEKKLTTAAGLKYHIKTHTGVRKFACPSCGRRFLTCTNMRKHIRIVHSGIRPHLCTLCGRRFPSTDHLAKHVRHTHHNKREHVCKECNKKFLQGCHLAQHMWVHTGIKPYACPHCPNVYSAVCSLTKHLRRNHWEAENQKHIEEEKFYEDLLESEVQEENGRLISKEDGTIIPTIDNKHKSDDSTVVEIIEYEKLPTYHFSSPKKPLRPTKVYSTSNSSTRNNIISPKQCDKSAINEFYLLNTTPNAKNQYSYSVASLQESVIKTEEKQEGSVDNDGNTGMDMSNEDDIVIDGICGDVLEEEINVVIVSGDNIIVNGSDYEGQIMW